jgi:hypothetical protein
VSGTSRVRTAVAHAGASANRGARTCRTHGFEYYRHGTLSLFGALNAVRRGARAHGDSLRHHRVKRSEEAARAGRRSPASVRWQPSWRTR